MVCAFYPFTFAGALGQAEIQGPPVSKLKCAILAAHVHGPIQGPRWGQGEEAPEAV